MSQPTTDVRRSFIAPAHRYDRLMGRYLPTLGPAFADAAGIEAGQRVLDIGCGPGGLTVELVTRVGAAAVTAIDLSAPFVQACRERNPGVDVRVGVAEDLPFGTGVFDATLACLVVGFMSDATAGIAEMARVTRPGGLVAACFWDLAHMQALRAFWSGVAAVTPDRTGEVGLLGSHEGDLAALLTHADLQDVREVTLEARAEYADFADWWDPFTLGIGPAGMYLRSLDPTARRAVRQACERQFRRPGERFTLTARAWCAVGRRPREATPAATMPAPHR